MFALVKVWQKLAKAKAYVLELFYYLVASFKVPDLTKTVSCRFTTGF